MDSVRYPVDQLETLSANTEDSLLTTRNSSQTNSLSKDSSSSAKEYCKKKRKCGCSCCLILGVILTTLGILMLFYTPFEVMMRERLKMLPGLPAFEWWLDPPEEVLFRAFLFNYTNSEAFMNGTEERLNIQEIGPIVYREKLTHSNVVFNENGTLSFVAKRTAIFLPELNHVDLNSTIIVPNFAVLGMASFLYDASFFSKIGFNIMYRSVGSPIFVNTTIYNYLWNFTDPILEAGQRIYPSLVPFVNMGMLERIYSDFEDSATVYIGVENGNEKFFLMDKYHGSPYMPGHGASCADQVVNSTEGVLYPQNITKQSVLRYWRKTLCRVIPLYFERTYHNFDNHRVDTYKFTMPEDGYNRKANLSEDCYASKPILVDGLSDVSKCYNNIPMAASFPHFLYGSEDLKKSITGFQPNKTNHESYVILEPLTGIPIEAYARSQSNLIVRKLSGFNPDVQKFSDSVLPMFWLEYNQVGLPDYISNLMYITVEVLPNYQYYFISTILTSGAVILLVKILKCVRARSNKHNLHQNKTLHFERETFLNK